MNSHLIPSGSQAPHPDGPPAISVRGLHVTLGSSHILRGVDLDVWDGEFVAIQGPNGSGKSTLVKAITGILPISAGEISLFGKPVGDRSSYANMGYVPQRVGLTSGINSTALEVVSTGLLYGSRLRMPRDYKEQSHHALEQVGLAHRANSSLSVLSGGQQQRVLIARALIRNPQLLVLDEPVSGVDQRSQETFAHTLAHLGAQGKTIVIVLHGLGEFRSLVTRCVTLDQGAICHDAPLSDHSTDEHLSHEHVHPHEGYVEQSSALLSETGFEK